MIIGGKQVPVESYADMIKRKLIQAADPIKPKNPIAKVSEYKTNRDFSKALASKAMEAADKGDYIKHLNNAKLYIDKAIKHHKLYRASLNKAKTKI